MKLTDVQKIGLFKMLATKDLYSVGVEYGLDKHYKNNDSMKGAVYRNYSDVKNNPEEYGISKDTYDLVVDAVSSRKVATRDTGPTLAEQNDDMDIKDLVLSNRNKLAKLMGKKIDGITNAELKKMSLKDFGTLFGILFDKGQIISGQATEHIAHLSKVEDGLGPEELLQTVLKQRDHEIEKKTT